MSFNQKDYIKKFNRSTYKMFPFRVKRSDEEIINKLTNSDSMNAYILSLIQKDISHEVLTIKEIKTKIKPIMSKHGIENIYLFGSYSRGEATPNSDVDIYCDSGDIKTFIDQGFLEDELKEALKKDVDVIFIGTKLNDYFKKQLDEDKIKIC